MGSCPTKPVIPPPPGPVPEPPKNCTFKVGDEVQKIGDPNDKKKGKIESIDYDKDGLCNSLTVKYDDGVTEKGSLFEFQRPPPPPEKRDPEPEYKLPDVPKRFPGAIPKVLEYKEAPNRKCEDMVATWLSSYVKDKANITVEEVTRVLGMGVTEAELEQCIEYFKSIYPELELPNKPWGDEPPPPPGPVKNCSYNIGDRVQKTQDPNKDKIGTVKEIKTYNDQTGLCIDILVQYEDGTSEQAHNMYFKRAPPPAKEPAPIQPDTSAKVNEFIEFMNSKLPGTTWENLDSTREALTKIISILGYSPAIKIAEKQKGDANLTKGTRFVNVEARSDGNNKWISKPMLKDVPSLTDKIIQQKGGAVTKYSFVIYVPSSPAGGKRTRRKGNKKRRKTRKH
jgi:hypothetical protein